MNPIEYDSQEGDLSPQGAVPREEVPQAEPVFSQAKPAPEAEQEPANPQPGAEHTDGFYSFDARYDRFTAEPAPERGATYSGIPPFQAESMTPPPAPPLKKERKKHPWLGRIALVLAGGLVGGLLAGAIFWGKLDQVQDQMEKLSAQGSGTVINTVSTPAGNIATGDMLSPAQVYAQSAQAVVSVSTSVYYNNGWTSGYAKGAGSGFILTPDGYILTNYHVIEGATEVKVTTMDSQEFEATIVGYDAFSDVALLKVEATELPAVIVGDSDVLRVGDMVAAIGNPLGELASTQTVGYVSAKNRLVNTDGTVLNMIQTDAAINSGNSGGPLFNMYGQVVGITTAKYSGSSSSGASIEGIGFAIPINAVMELVSDLMDYGYVKGQAYLGIGVEEMDADVAEAYGLPSGPKVLEINEGSCAQKAGLQVGDIITGLGDKDINCYADLTYALRSYRAGDTAQLRVFRKGAELSLTVTFDEKPASTEPVPTEPVATQPQQGNSNGYGYSWPFGEFFPFLP